MKEWIVKVRRYSPDGVERPGSIVGSYDDPLLANYKASEMNTQSHTYNYYVEKFDPAKLTSGRIKPTSDLTDEELIPQW